MTRWTTIGGSADEFYRKPKGAWDWVLKIGKDICTLLASAFDNLSVESFHRYSLSQTHHILKVFSDHSETMLKCGLDSALDTVVEIPTKHSGDSDAQSSRTTFRNTKQYFVNSRS